MNNEYKPDEIQTPDAGDELTTEGDQLEFSFENGEGAANDDDNFSAFDLVRMIICATCFIIVVLSFLFRTSVVDGSSMYPTLSHQNMLVTSNLFFEPKGGDIVIFEHSDYTSSLVKRVIATEGQTVEIDENGTIYVDGKALHEPYANISGVYDHTHTSVQFPYTVPADHVFVMGDNRNKSEDSRWFGAINEQQILGKVYMRLTGGFGLVD